MNSGEWTMSIRPILFTPTVGDTSLPNCHLVVFCHAGHSKELRCVFKDVSPLGLCWIFSHKTVEVNNGV